MLLPGFSFDKYAALRKRTPTIISPNCWAGILYNRFGLAFKSPLINMYEDYDYLKLLKNFNFYMQQPLQLYRMQFKEELKREYQIVRCGDILLHANQYYSFEEVNECWERRKLRIDYNNMFVMIYDHDEERVKSFLRLDYDKKIGFIDKKTDVPGIVSLDYSKKSPNLTFWRIIYDSAFGQVFLG